jgi:hypothetical protein
MIIMLEEICLFLRKMWFESISKGFRDNFVNYIAETNWPKILRHYRLHLFRNQSDKGLINLRLHEGSGIKICY